jgi:hypothetical protein
MLLDSQYQRTAHRKQGQRQLQKVQLGQYVPQRGSWEFLLNGICAPSSDQRSPFSEEGGLAYTQLT